MRSGLAIQPRFHDFVYRALVHFAGGREATKDAVDAGSEHDALHLRRLGSSVGQLIDSPIQER